MATSRDKLTNLRTELQPQLEQYLSTLGPMAGTVASFIRPQAEAWVDGQLDKSDDELDDGIARLIGFLGSLRSDDSRRVLATPTGGAYVPEAFEHTGRLDPLRAQDLPDGNDGQRQESTSESTLPVGSSASAGD